MLTQRPLRWAISLSSAWFCIAALVVAAEPLTGKLPSGALASIEIERAGQTIAAVQTSEFLKTLSDSQPYQAWSNSADGRKFRGGRAVLEGQMGMNLWEAAQRLFGHRIAVGIYPPAQSRQPDVVAVLEFAAADTSQLLREKLEPWVELAADKVTAEQSGDWWHLRTNDGKAHLSLTARHCILSNSAERHTAVVQQFTQTRESSVLNALAWKHAQTVDDSALSHARAVVDLQGIRQLTNQSRLLPAKTDNPLASLLFGGTMEVAGLSDSAVANLAITAQSAALRLQFPTGRNQVDAPHRTLLQPVSANGRELIPQVPRQLGGVTLSCDWAEWYRQRDQLLAARVLPEFDKFESGLANLIPGKDFAEDVLALLKSPISLVSAVQTYPHLDGRPGLQLPAFAVVLDLKDAQRGADVFQLFFQTLGTVVNIEAGKNGRQPWVMSSEAFENTQINFAKYLDRPQGTDLPVIFNFQPAAALVGDRYIASTSLELCRDLIVSLKGQSASHNTKLDGGRNFELQLTAAPFRTLVETNRAVITARSLQQGKDLQRATQELDILLQVLQQLSSTSLTSQVSGHELEWRWEGSWK